MTVQTMNQQISDKGDNMGEYIYYVNLDKKEFFKLVPYKFAENMAGEQPKILLWLLIHDHADKGLGWGDTEGYKYLGRWSGDRIMVIGDYDPLFEKLNILDGFKNITCNVVKEVMDYARKEGIKELYEFLKDGYEIECRESQKHH